MRGFALCFATLCLVDFSAPAFGADSFASDWSKSLKSTARLIAAGRDEKFFRAGVEIDVDPNTITYWRNPGDAGVPPVFDFSRSQNVARMDVLFPVPHTFLENGARAIGYTGKVILPIHVFARDPTLPVVLNMKLDYAACGKICVPARAEARLLLSNAEDSPYREMIASFEALVPLPVSLAMLGATVTTASDAPADKPAWTVSIPLDAAAQPDLFVEGPVGWVFDVTSSANVAGDTHQFRIELAAKPEDGTLPVPITLTMSGGKRPVEMAVRFDAIPNP
jgi:DsbC/DsbD-like thiol-disulfide interchange protein